MDLGTKSAAVRRMTNAMFDAVAEAGTHWDEGRWEEFVRLVDAAGRFVFGYPHIYDDTSSIFGALDDIARDIERSREALVEAAERAPTPRGTSTVDASKPSIPAESVKVSVPEPDEPEQVVHIQPVVPSEEDEAMGERATYASVERALGMASSRATQRMNLLEKYGTLPADIAAWRRTRKAGPLPGSPSPRTIIENSRKSESEHVSEVAAAIRAREAAALTDSESFETRRKANASAKAAETWAQRNGRAG